MVWRRFEILGTLEAWWMGRKSDFFLKNRLWSAWCRMGLAVRKMGMDVWYVPRTECGLRELVWIRKITNVKYIYHKVWYCGFEFEILKCFFRIKALAGGDGHGDSFQSGQKQKLHILLRRHVVWENAFGCSECMCSHLFCSTFWNFLSKNASTPKQGNHDSC